MKSNLIIQDYLNNIQSKKEITNESFIALQIVLVLMSLIIQIIPFLISTENKSLSKKLNKVLKSSGWKVKVFAQSAPNAMTMGTKHLLITTGLLRRLNERQIIAVMLHEAGHTKHLDVPVGFGIGTIGMVLANVALKGSKVASIILFVASMFLPKLYKIIVGKKLEYFADSTAIKYGYGKELAQVLKIFLKIQIKKTKNMKKIEKFFFKLSLMLDEHPDLEKRINKLLLSDELNKAVESGDKNKIGITISKLKRIKENDLSLLLV